MKKTTIYILSAIVLAIIAVVLIMSSSRSTFRKEYSNFAVDDTSSVTKIFMADKNNNVLTLSRENGNWKVNGKYPAQPNNMQMLLSTILHLEVKSPVANAAKENIIRYFSSTGVKVEIYQRKSIIDIFGIKLFPREKLTKVYYVGPATQDNRGTFMIMEKSDQPYIVYLPGLRGFVSTRYTPVEKYWRDYSIFRKNIAEIKSLKMEFPGAPGESFQVINSGNRQITMASIDNSNILAFDTLRMMNFLSAFRSITFEALLNDVEKTQKDSIVSSQPYCIITLTDTSNTINKVITYRKMLKDAITDETGRQIPFDLDRLYALVNDGQDLTLAQYFVMDKVLRPKSWFMQQRPSGKPE